MRILMISDVYFPRINGVSTSIQTFRKELETLGHEVQLITPSYPQAYQHDNNIYRIPSRELPFDPEDRLMKRQYIAELMPLLPDQQFDILHIQTPFVAHYAGLKLAKHLNIPAVETYHTHFEEYFYHYLPYVPKPLLKFAARRINCRQCNAVDALVVPSTAMFRVLHNYGVKKPISIIPTGLDEALFKPGDGTAFRTKHNIPNDRPVIVHIGRAAHEKNIDFLLQMLADVRKTIPDILFVIAGEGPALSHLQSLSQTLNIHKNVLFVGYLDRESELLDCYRAGNAFVFASRTETQGLVLLEAMAQSTPVVSTARLGTIDILKANQGAVVAEENIEDFSDKLIGLLQKPEQQSQLSDEALAYARSWSSQQMALKKVEFYQRIIDSFHSHANDFSYGGSANG